MTKGRVLLILILWAIQVLVIGVLLPMDWLDRQVQREQEMTAAWLGQNTTEIVVNRANDLFTSAFDDTGLIDASFRLVPTREEREASVGMEDLGAPAWPYVNERLQIMWLTVYQGISRLSMLMLWLPYFLPIILPALIHGWTIREIKKVSYGYASPVVYHSAAHSLVALIFLPLFYITIPIAVHPAFVLAWGIGFAVTVLALASNFQKQL